ncbi:MAG: Txe/YoeB family addiction module toxin [Roseibacillus sp.]|nr:Txe/YoeB family addiction module toxin [Roseibacillus sp.]
MHQRPLTTCCQSVKARELLDSISEDPFAEPPSFEALVGDLKGPYSRRINIQHRLVCQVYEKERIVKALRLWRRTTSKASTSRWWRRPPPPHLNRYC